MSKTRIGKGTRIEGRVESSGAVQVLGQIDGELVARNVVIEASGQVRAEVRADKADVAGTVEGDILGKELVELRAEAKMNGNIRAERILIADGARFKGNVDMDGAGDGLED